MTHRPWPAAGASEVERFHHRGSGALAGRVEHDQVRWPSRPATNDARDLGPDDGDLIEADGVPAGIGAGPVAALHRHDRPARSDRTSQGHGEQAGPRIEVRHPLTRVRSQPVEHAAR